MPPLLLPLLLPLALLPPLHYVFLIVLLPLLVLVAQDVKCIGVDKHL
jgi:hypothetical protein